MRLFTRPLAAAIVTATCYVFMPLASAPAQVPPSGPSTSKPDLSDQKLSAAAAALEQVVSVKEDYQQRIAQAEAPDEKQRLAKEANNQLAKAVTEHGLSVDEYSSILDAARDNPEIRDKILQRIRPSDK